MSVTWHMSTIKYNPLGPAQNPMAPGKTTSNGDYGHWFHDSSSAPGSASNGSGHPQGMGQVAVHSPQGLLPSKPNIIPGHMYSGTGNHPQHVQLPGDAQNSRVYSFMSRVNTNGELYRPEEGKTRTTVIISRRPSDTPRNSPDQEYKGNLMNLVPNNAIIRPLSRERPTGTLMAFATNRPVSRELPNGTLTTAVADKRDTTGQVSTYITTDYNNHSANGLSPRGYAAVGPRPAGLHRSNTITEIESPRKPDRTFEIQRFGELGSPRKSERRDFQELSLRRSRSFHEPVTKGWKIPTDVNVGEFTRNAPQYSSLGRVRSRYMFPTVPNSNLAQGNQPVESANSAGSRTPIYWMAGSPHDGSANSRLDHFPANRLDHFSANQRQDHTHNGMADSKIIYATPNLFGKPLDTTWTSNALNRPNEASIHRTDPSLGRLDSELQNRQNGMPYDQSNILLSPRSLPQAQIKVSNSHLVNEPKMVPTFPSHDHSQLLMNKAATLPFANVRVRKSILKKKSAYEGQNRYETISQPLSWGTPNNINQGPLNRPLPSINGQYNRPFNIQTPEETTSKVGSTKRVTFAM